MLRGMGTRRRSLLAALAATIAAAGGVAVAGLAPGSGLGMADALADTVPPATTQPPATTAPPAETVPAPPAPGAPAVAAGVSAAGIPLEGLSPQAAVDRLRSAYLAPLKVKVGKRVFTLAPAEVQQRVRIREAVGRALRRTMRGDVKVDVSFNDAAVTRAVARYVQATSVAPADAGWEFRGVRPVVRPHRVGLVANERPLRRKIVSALRYPGGRAGIAVVRAGLQPRVLSRHLPPAVVISRGANRLTLYRARYGKARVVRTYGVATGTSQYPTPRGLFQIVTMQRHPWWYPPDSDWARGQAPVPPGPNNPLGTRWMGISAPGVGIHGTPNPTSIGYSASHGCIRMRIPEAEQLFRVVRVGTPVLIY
jgi:lipoprotein-anchoring transpeptidase ErfK/SrfK